MGKDVKISGHVGSNSVGGQFSGDSEVLAKCLGKVALVALAAYAGTMSIKYFYEKSCKKAGLNTKNNPHNNELGPRNPTREDGSTSIGPTIGDVHESADGDNSLPEQIPHPWKGYKRTPVKARPEDAPAPKENRLLDVYIRAGRIVFLFAPTDVGKTTLAVQLAYEMAFEKDSKIFPNSVIRHPKKVIYYDEEYQGESFQKEGYRNMFEINDGRFLYTQGAHDGIDDMLEAIYNDANQKEYEGHDIVMFIDNIKAVCKGTYSGKGSNGEGRFINSLKSIKNYLEDKKGIRLTVVVIAHTTSDAADEKRYKTITEKNLQGTNDQSDFANELIALGDTRIGPEYKRVKALKNKELPKDGKVWVVKRVDGTTFECVGYELESDTIDKKIAPALLSKYTSGNTVYKQLDSASPDSEEGNGTKASYSREKIELTEEQLVRCREVYEDAISSGKGKTAALKETAGEVLGDEGKYKTVERRLGL